MLIQKVKAIDYLFFLQYKELKYLEKYGESKKVIKEIYKELIKYKLIKNLDNRILQLKSDIELLYNAVNNIAYYPLAKKIINEKNEISRIDISKYAKFIAKEYKLKLTELSLYDFILLIN